VVVACLIAAGSIRSAGGYDSTAPNTVVGDLINNVSSPLYVTNEIVQRVPSIFPYTEGSTYLEALKRQLPGPIANGLFGPPTDTGAYQFRVIEGYYNPNQGYSFALPAEGYLNFGVVGVALAGMVLGLSLGLSWNRTRGVPQRARQIVYPVILVALPVGLRSDALTQIKLVLAPVVIVAIVLAICRLPSSASQRSGPKRPSQRATVNAMPVPRLR
jgi:hypothetical protein